MSSKSALMTGTIIGTSVGSMIPLLWGDSLFSVASVLLTALGGIAGLYIAYKITH